MRANILENFDQSKRASQVCGYRLHLESMVVPFLWCVWSVVTSLVHFGARIVVYGFAMFLMHLDLLYNILMFVLCTFCGDSGGDSALKEGHSQLHQNTTATPRYGAAPGSLLSPFVPCF